LEGSAVLVAELPRPSTAGVCGAASPPLNAMNPGVPGAMLPVAGVAGAPRRVPGAGVTGAMSPARKARKPGVPGADIPGVPGAAGVNGWNAGVKGCAPKAGVEGFAPGVNGWAPGVNGWAPPADVGGGGPRGVKGCTAPGVAGAGPLGVKG